MVLSLLFLLVITAYRLDVSGEKYISGDNRDEIAATQYLSAHNRILAEKCNIIVQAEWNYSTNITDENKQKLLEESSKYAEFQKEAWQNITSFAWKDFKDPLIRRWFKKLSILGKAALPNDQLKELDELIADMKNIYSTSKVCPFNSKETDENCNLSLEPELTEILTKSRNYDELAYIWKAWRDVSGKRVKDKYIRFIELSNKAAELNGFRDTGELWRERYESDTFQQEIEQLWQQIRPLYEQLHAYVRRKLINIYGSDKIRHDGPIPAHILGNMWAQDWSGILQDITPYPEKPSVDITPKMIAKNMSALEIFKISEEFFTSVGLKAMTDEFWERSIIEKPKDREIVCHASAWDFCDGKDFRIKQCTSINMEDFIVTHHEMGHIQYYQQYAHQPCVFREGANPGFHEAVGDCLALSTSTPKHLQTIGLLDHIAEDKKGDVNFLFSTALSKLAFLPFGYLIDLWRWGIFSGDIKSTELNTKWWELRLKYQGICPPVERTENDFDPGSKYHVPGNTPYVRYFVSHVIQFQFHKSLCEAAGHVGPLHKCDIYKSKDAGKVLSQMLELGSSEIWNEAMNIMTGGVTNKMDAGPMFEYFEPLYQWLKEENKGEVIGWKSGNPLFCP
uniref:Angiotensin-converting enzyme n=1 Tax=Tityus serrulatus TaxID=6887 RepID=A0A1S5QMZ5_TITSE|nr:angiotensin-converting protein 1 [Tityus serrulatus]